MVQPSSGQAPACLRMELLQALQCSLQQFRDSSNHSRRPPTADHDLNMCRCVHRLCIALVVSLPTSSPCTSRPSSSWNASICDTTFSLGAGISPSVTMRISDMLHSSCCRRARASSNGLSTSVPPANELRKKCRSRWSAAGERSNSRELTWPGPLQTRWRQHSQCPSVHFMLSMTPSAAAQSNHDAGNTPHSMPTASYCTPRAPLHISPHLQNMLTLQRMLMA